MLDIILGEMLLIQINLPLWKRIGYTATVLRLAKRAPANVRRLNNRKWRQRYCLVGKRSRAIAVLNAAQVDFTVYSGRISP